jgi:DNA-binding protein HU-beta
LAEATQTDQRTAGVFLDTLSALAYKEIKKNGEFVLPGFGKLVKQKRKSRTGFNPKTQQKIKIPAKTVVKFVLPRPQRTSPKRQRVMAGLGQSTLEQRTATCCLDCHLDLLQQRTTGERIGWGREEWGTGSSRRLF